MRLADRMKLERDGQLSYGKPDVWRQRIEACIAANHAGHGCVGYSDGWLRCLGCFQDFRHPSGGGPA